MSNFLNDVRKEIKKYSSSEKANIYARFFKTDKGEYGEGDKFAGLTVPETRAIAKKFLFLNFKEIDSLLKSEIHEERLIALLILVENFKKSNELEKKKIFDYYLSRTKFINNWDLVDLSSDKIVGAYLLNKKNRIILYSLAMSNNLWERRIAVVSTYHFIKNNDYFDVLKISEMLLNDKHDLIHKATGWMLREAGKRDKLVLFDFLNKYSKLMPRTMLRYSIEKLSESERKKFMKK